MKRPFVVWIYSFLVIFAIMVEISSSLLVLNKPGTLPLAYYIEFISLVLVIPELTFITLFFMLKKSSLIWLYISFGLFFIMNIIMQHWIYAGAIAVFGWVVWDYIVHKKVFEQPLFN